MAQNNLIVELETVISDGRHAELVRNGNLGAEIIDLQVWMTYGNVAEVMRVSPMVLRVEHHRFGAGAASGMERGFKINIEMFLGGRVALPLHHPVGLKWRDDSRLLVLRLERGAIGINALCRHRGSPASSPRPRCRPQSSGRFCGRA